MKVLDSNPKLLLVSNKTTTYILNKPNLTIFGQCEIPFKLGSLQYYTGIAAFGKGSLIHIYDFKYNRTIETIDTFLQLVQVRILKNLIIGVSEQRILIHDLQAKTNLCHIPTWKGEAVAIHPDYYSLKLIYPVKSHIYEEQDIWSNKIARYEFHETASVHYDRQGKVTCFVNQNVAEIYESDQILKGCSMNSKIIRVVAGCSPGIFYFMTEGGGIQNAPLFMQFGQSSKKYLKMGQKIEIESQVEGDSQGIMFTHQDNLYIWAHREVYQAQVDDQPIFFDTQHIKWNPIKQLQSGEKQTEEKQKKVEQESIEGKEEEVND